MFGLLLFDIFDELPATPKQIIWTAIFSLFNSKDPIGFWHKLELDVTQQSLNVNEPVLSRECQLAARKEDGTRPHYYQSAERFVFIFHFKANDRWNC